jgi:hypothetical protein
MQSRCPPSAKPGSTAMSAQRERPSLDPAAKEVGDTHRPTYSGSHHKLRDVGPPARSTRVMAATPHAGWRILLRKKNRLCAVQSGHLRRGALCPDSRVQIHFADRRRLLPLHDQNRAVIGRRAAMGLEPRSAEECQRRRYGKLRWASVLLDALLESSQKALPILTIAVHHTTSLHSHGRRGQRETQNVGIQVSP